MQKNVNEENQEQITISVEIYWWRCRDEDATYKTGLQKDIDIKGVAIPPRWIMTPRHIHCGEDPGQEVVMLVLTEEVMEELR